MKFRSAPQILPPPTYMWHRQLNGLLPFQKLRGARGILPPETAKKSEYLRCQFGLFYFDGVLKSFEGRWDGKDVIFDAWIRPLLVDYAALVYAQAVNDVLTALPTCTRHYFESGPLIGERRLIFPDGLDEVATRWLVQRFDEIAEIGNIEVRESLEILPSADGRRVRLNFAEDREEYDAYFEEELPHVFAELRSSVLAQTPFALETEYQSFELDHELFVQEFSLPELVALNWETAKPPNRGEEFRLFDAIRRCDLPRITKALAEGANPNAVADDNETVLVKLIRTLEDRSGNGFSLVTGLESVLAGIDFLVDAGASVNWAPLNTFTPLALACHIGNLTVIARLLELGADPTIRCDERDHMDSLGTTWDIAGDGNPEIWNLLLKFWPNPFGMP